MIGAVMAIIFAAVFWFAGTYGLARGRMGGALLCYLLAAGLTVASILRLT